ncbi:hypothetical protein F441_13230 [Phytophthora nicotianae CJ01A1]|uniref:M96 mating-specific protein family n=4 Tax=Phytophthora nicotianae TaxID=4792 RepID=V9ETU0_PHYNI|nr:hypothetical protein F443_13280 [Phytophthora nicotianae P1569]ETK81514.1 hypothetical protein L915_12977 [Phytophthora nicotianae]ETL34925.1 hypothetical protein L916_12879 [Phytophthora nicotianae]ETP11220.1 hypothetical protein F441_13230 [Phytophthora nicotianae CJ01A1]ETP39363.1 hypothetical protein F442_13150 [Phytophthora nicotianae P10297]
MSFPLLEDDDEAFTEVLALLDEYNAAVEESPRAHSRSKHASPFSSLAESSAWTAFEAAHPITKTTSKHRNGAREMRRREVQFLRTCVKGLETQLTALKEGAQQRAQLRNATTHSGGQSSALMSVWKDLATRQLDQRLASERENSRLKCAMEDQKKVREMLQRALNTRVARRVMETNLTQEKRTRRVHGVPLELSDQEVFQELEVGVDSVYHEAARVFFQADTGDGTCLGVFGEKTLPFDLHTTAEAAWRCLAHAFQHEKYHFSYSRERRKDESGEVAHDDTVCESFGVEIKAPERMADFRIKQVFRRYREADRIVIAWRSYIDPAEFKGQKLEGIRFQEKGSCVIRHPHPTKLHTASNEVTLLRIWHVITPETLANTNGTINSSQFVQDLTDFVLGGSSSASTVQMIENMLIEQSRRNNADCVV